MTDDTRPQEARQLALDCFARGFNCAEAVLLGVTQAFGMDFECVPQIATGFGAGIGCRGDTCGAVSGAVMALGLRFGRTDPEDQAAKSALYEMERQFLAEFEHEFGSIRCIDLTGCEMRTPEGRARSTELKLHTDVCPKFVAFAAERAAMLMD